LASVVDIGCGDGRLINSLWVDDPHLQFFGVDRSLDRASDGPATFTRDLERVPRNDVQIVLANELFDAIPFARLVKRGDRLHELWVTERNGELDWAEHEADAAFEHYFTARGIELQEGQFADVSLEWESTYETVARFVTRGLIVTFDYGLPEGRLFRGRIRRFGTAAAYAEHRVSRDLLANPGRQDLTAHINFTDLIRAGERAGFTTLFFDSQAKFLLAAGAHEHPLLQPDETVDSLEVREQRERAKRLILPDGIGEDIRVLVQGRGVPLEGWAFQRRLF
jgi:SAM-dependent MidA family methyltransferase